MAKVVPVACLVPEIARISHHRRTDGGSRCIERTHSFGPDDETDQSAQGTTGHNCSQELSTDNEDLNKVKDIGRPTQTVKAHFTISDR